MITSLEWNKLLQDPNYILCELSDVRAHIEDALASGDFTLSLTSEQISASLSIQFDSENNTALLASNDAQILLSLEDEEALFHILYERRDARYEALHTPIVVMEDQFIHTDATPFCNDLTCFCHYSPEYHLSLQGIPLIGRL